MINVLESTKYVVDNSRFVKINRDKIKELAGEWNSSKLVIPGWDVKYHFFDDSEKTCEYLFVLDSINFCFWAKNENDKWKIDYNGKKIGGYNALAFLLKKLFGNRNFSSFSEFTYSEFRKLFYGEKEIPLIKERFDILQENYKILKNKHSGKFSILIEACDYDVLRILPELVDNFSSFRDEVEYKRKKIAFYKRAQILIGDLYCAFGGKKWGNLKNLEKLTMFADYKIPQILRGYGILEYADSLGNKINNRELILPDSEEEVEIRANTIWAGEFIKEELRKNGINMRSFKIDWVLWNQAQEKGVDLKPHHFTETIFY
jgi:hypothetical protein